MSQKNALFTTVKDSIAFDQLWQQTTECIHALSGDIWTDTTEHDPGTTLLQAATYNISDLSYRTTLSLNDLLTHADRPILFPENFGPQNMLTCGPVSAEDYQHALLDLHSSDMDKSDDKREADFLLQDARLIKEPDAERFCWWYNSEKRQYTFAPEENKSSQAVEKKLTLRGNCWLYLLPTRYTEQTKDKSAINAHIQNFLNNHRNLGESISRIIWLQPVLFEPHVVIELNDDVSDINKLVAQLYRVFSQQILPQVTRQTTVQRRALGDSSEEIFDGPYLQHGWQQGLPSGIQDDGIIVNLSPLINQLLQIEGISSVTELKLAIPFPEQIHVVAGDAWSVQVDAGYYPQLWGADPLSTLCAKNGPVKLVAKGGINLAADKDRVASALSSPPLIQTQPEVLPAGKLRNLSRYTPVGDRLPECYQTQQPLSAITDTVNRLHQFLLPVDQLLADAAAELQQLPELLSFTERGNQIRGTRWPYEPGSVNQAVHQKYAATLTEQQQADSAIFPDQSNTPNQPNYARELDYLQYLLSYFGVTRAARPLTFDMRDFLETQRGYLARQPELGYERINIRIDSISALQKRIAARIGLNSECFAANPDLGNLPFYLIEHRQLLPGKPNPAFTAEQTPADFSVNGKLITLKQTGSAGKLVRGQLIKLIAIEGDSRLYVSCQVITDISGDSFTLSTDNSTQLARDLSRLQTAWSSGNLRWQNSNVWLQDMDYVLNYAPQAEQPANDQQRLLTSNDQSPFPSMINVGDKLVITVRHLLSAYDLPSSFATGSDWQLTAEVKAFNPIAGTLLIEKTSDSKEAFPTASEAWKYQWNFSSSAYASTNRFSFVISIVTNLKLIEGKDIDAAKLNDWLQETILEEFPAHVALISHWLSDSSFQNFAETYQRWQNSGNPLGDDAYGLMQMLTLGHLPASQLGIGLMRVATEEQRTDVVGKEGTEWHTDVIVSNELLYVPQDMKV